jgi:hypothetical protein
MNEDLAKHALEILAAHRQLRETAEDRWERSIGTAIATGNSRRTVAEVAGVSHMTVQRIAKSLHLEAS